jgi:hypothetical protein
METGTPFFLSDFNNDNDSSNLIEIEDDHMTDDTFEDEE